MLSLFDEESKIVTSGLGNHKFRVAGIAGIAWHNLNLVDARIKLLIKFTEYHFSKVSIKYVKLWVGLKLIRYNMTPLAPKAHKSVTFYSIAHAYLV